MKCEFCHTYTMLGEVVHGFKYGEIDIVNDVFLPAKDSAWTVICKSCGEEVYKLIYSKLNPTR
jgi:hypothetical protein